jgi:acyl homoserine lactone synthase
MIECVNIETNHLFPGIAVSAQHKLRYTSLIERQRWNIPHIRNMEYDSYDNLATYYLVKRDAQGAAIGCSRLYPTTQPYMLQQVFPHLVTRTPMPQAADTWEASRFCVDARLPHEQRRALIGELVVSYLEFALDNSIKRIVGVMIPMYWRSIFINSGWPVEWLGDIHRDNEGRKIIAGEMPVSASILADVRRATGIADSVVNYGAAAPDSLAYRAS